jgi:hypothetical protein
MTLGIAVIGAGMAGRAHAAAYRIAPTLYQSTLPPLRFVSIGDVSPELGSLAARRFGYDLRRAEAGARRRRHDRVSDADLPAPHFRPDGRGQEVRELALGLLADCSTRIIYNPTGRRPERNRG